jgi:UDP-N-acetylglucosamine transferase subunit ALG13
MIFVTIGTTEPFDRLLRALDGLDGEELVVQCGDSLARPARATCIEYVSFDELGDYMRRARVVVSHAGVGTIMAALAAGKRPVVVPRLAAFDEVVDDHQVELARRLDARGLVTLVEDPSTLAGIVRSADPAVALDDARPSELVGELRDFVEAHVGRGTDASRKTRLRRVRTLRS